jgi:hypothetical protein
VIAVRADDPDSKSPESNVDLARPLAFQATFNTDQQIPPADFCFVQRLSAARLHNSGSNVRLTVQGAASGNLLIHNIYVSRVAPSGDPYDALPAGNPGGLTKIADAVTLTDGNAKALTYVPYAIDPSQDLLIAFDFTATATQANTRYDTSPGVALFFQPNAQEAAQADRSSGYVVQADPRNYLVTKIEVL